MNIILKLNDVDYSSYLPRRGYNITYKDILGSNSCYTLDGKYHEDILASKAIISTELLPMTSERLSAMVKACESCKRATYFDTKTNQVVTRDAKASLSTASLVMNKTNKTFWNDSNTTGITITIEEI